MSLPEACCTLPSVASDYVPEGTEVSLGQDLKIYEARNRDSKIVLICAYDIFGFHPNVKQFADKLNSSGLFRVVMPDFFRGHPLSMENFPPDRSEIMKFISTRGSWDLVVKNDLQAVLNHYKAQGVTSFGIYGFCWGGKMSIKGVSEVEGISAAALIHPSLVDTADAEAAKGAVLFLPTKDEPDMIPLYEIVKQKLGAEKTAHHRFEDMFHGFAGARGNWAEEIQRERVNEAITMTHDFFKKQLVQ